MIRKSKADSKGNAQVYQYQKMIIKFRHYVSYQQFVVIDLLVWLVLASTQLAEGVLLEKILF